MSKTIIPRKTALQLWVQAGGRCEFPGCNKPLWRDELTFAEINAAYIAHIIADQPGGPRGDPVLSPKLAKSLSNLMLLCGVHHTTIDDNEHWREYPVELLGQYKARHEERIELLSSLGEDKKTHLLYFTDNVAYRKYPFSFELARAAVLPHRYPAESRAIEIDLSNSPFRDHEPSYFENRQEEVRRMVESRVRQRLRTDDIKHLSIFALAGIPLLVHFGYELGDMIPSDLYQLHRDTNSWDWQPASESDKQCAVEWPDFRLCPCGDKVAVNLSLSGVVRPEEITTALEGAYYTYKLSISEPDCDYLKSRGQLDQFAASMRGLLNRIREKHGASCSIHIFPAIPAPVAVKLGQLMLPKSDPIMHVYDNHIGNGGFRRALTIQPRRV